MIKRSDCYSDSNDDGSVHRQKQVYMSTPQYKSCIHDGIWDTYGFDSDPEPWDELSIHAKLSSQQTVNKNNQRKSVYRKRSPETRKTESRITFSPRKELEDKYLNKTVGVNEKTEAIDNEPEIEYISTYTYTYLDTEDVPTSNLLEFGCRIPSKNDESYDLPSMDHDEQARNLADIETPKYFCQNQNELHIEKYFKNSKLDKFRSPYKCQLTQETPKESKEKKEVQEEYGYDTPDKSPINKGKSSLLKYTKNYKLQSRPSRADKCLESNSRRKRTMSKSKNKIDNIFNHLSNHWEDEPENQWESLLETRKSDIYLKYKEMFEREQPVVREVRKQRDKDSAERAYEEKRQSHSYLEPKIPGLNWVELKREIYHIHESNNSVVRSSSSRSKKRKAYGSNEKSQHERSNETVIQPYISPRKQPWDTDSNWTPYKFNTSDSQTSFSSDKRSEVKNHCLRNPRQSRVAAPDYLSPYCFNDSSLSPRKSCAQIEVRKINNVQKWDSVKSLPVTPIKSLKLKNGKFLSRKKIPREIQAYLDLKKLNQAVREIETEPEIHLIKMAKPTRSVQEQKKEKNRVELGFQLVQDILRRVNDKPQFENKDNDELFQLKDRLRCLLIEYDDWYKLNDFFRKLKNIVQAKIDKKLYGKPQLDVKMNISESLNLQKNKLNLKLKLSKKKKNTEGSTVDTTQNKKRTSRKNSKSMSLQQPAISSNQDLSNSVWTRDPYNGSYFNFPTRQKAYDHDNSDLVHSRTYDAPNDSINTSKEHRFQPVMNGQPLLRQENRKGVNEKVEILSFGDINENQQLQNSNSQYFNQASWLLAEEQENIFNTGVDSEQSSSRKLSEESGSTSAAETYSNHQRELALKDFRAFKAKRFNYNSQA